jgi:hypothetical protein
MVHRTPARVQAEQLGYRNLQKRVRWLEEVVRRKSGLSVSELPTGTPVDGEGKARLAADNLLQPPYSFLQIFQLVSGNGGASDLSIDVSQARSKRVSTACDFCRKRKKKCDFRYPNCSSSHRTRFCKFSSWSRGTEALAT